MDFDFQGGSKRPPFFYSKTRHFPRALCLDGEMRITNAGSTFIVREDLPVARLGITQQCVSGAIRTP
jgi:hypothetical protein